MFVWLFMVRMVSVEIANAIRTFAIYMPGIGTAVVTGSVPSMVVAAGSVSLVQSWLQVV